MKYIEPSKNNKYEQKFCKTKGGETMAVVKL